MAGEQESAEVVPAAPVRVGLGFTEEAPFVGAAQDRPHIDTQGDVVVFDALLERRGIDDILVIVV